jgi:hypothetical protein
MQSATSGRILSLPPPALDECISHITRLYLKKLKEPKKLMHYLRVALADSRVFTRAMQQVNGWEDKQEHKRATRQLRRGEGAGARARPPVVTRLDTDSAGAPE